MARQTMRALLLTLVTIALTATLAAMLTACRDTRARVVIENQSECGAIAVRLTNTQTNAVLRDSVPNGESREFEVQPDVYYEYLIDFTAAGRTADNFRCTSLEEGRVRVPAGSRQTFVLRSERQTPPSSPTP